MRTDANPCWVNAKGQCEMLERIPFRKKEFDEGFLQDLLHKHPEILPVDEIDSSFAPLLPLAREVEGVDNLFISPSGRLTVVETKLWRNPEAAREVLAQIIEYASKMSSWTYDDLENKVKNANESALKDKKSIYDLVKMVKSDEPPPFSESSFIDETSRSLVRCRFLLLIVGDGIREGLEQMLEALHRHANLHFTLALVEMQLWKRKSDSGVLVIPRIVAKTKEVVRTVVKATGTVGVGSDVDDIEDETEKGASGYKRITLSKEEFFEGINDDAVKKFYEKLLNYTETLSITHVWKSASVVLKLRDPKGSGRNFTILVLENKKTASVYTGWLPDQLKECGYSTKIADEFYDSLDKLLPKSKWRGKYENYVYAEELIPHYNAITEMIKKVVSSINSEAERST